MKQPYLLHQFVLAGADRHPERIAIAEGSRVWSYGELDGLSDNLAGHLQYLGAGIGSCVGLHMNRGGKAIASACSDCRAMLDVYYDRRGGNSTYHRRLLQIRC